MYDEPDDDYMTTEQAIDAGWLDPDEVDGIRKLVEMRDIDPRVGDRNDAILILLASRLGVIEDTDPHVLWAEQLLKPPA